MGLNAGDMDREIVLQTAPVVQSDSGEETFDWVNAENQTVWAEWVPSSTTESWRGENRLASYVDGVYRIYDLDPRPRPDNTRILGHDGRIFDIKPWVEIERGVGLEIAVVARGE